MRGLFAIGLALMLCAAGCRHDVGGSYPWDGPLKDSAGSVVTKPQYETPTPIGLQ